MEAQRIFTVSELNASIRAMLEARYPFIAVAGEISNLRRPGSGHCYFTLKDENAQIKAVLFRMQARYLREPLRDGQQVICRGRIGVYEPRGDYQLIVDAVDIHGTGALQIAFEELKRRLAAEGLFDEHLKLPLPQFPAHITLVTSPSGAAVHDFIRIAHARMPQVQLAIYPVAVQGEQASRQMIEAIQVINERVKTDIIVLCRGGGSIEDLWAYNDEQLARAIRASALPVVSAVGHEIDFTIADFAADLRAPTPSGAAEMLLPDSEQLAAALGAASRRLSRAVHQGLEKCQAKLSLQESRLGRVPRPLDPLFLRLDHYHIRLQQAMDNLLERRRNKLENLSLHLAESNPVRRLALHRQQLGHLFARLQRAQEDVLNQRRDGLARATGVLEAVSPLATLARGYAIVRQEGPESRILRDARQVGIGERVAVTLAHGGLRCRVEGKTRAGVFQGNNEDVSE